MMIVDLIDEVDLLDKLKACGVPVEAADSLDANLERVIDWCNADPAQAAQIAEQFRALEDSEITLLPEVESFIDQIREATGAF